MKTARNQASKALLMAAALMMAGCGFMKNSTTNTPAGNQSVPASSQPAAATTTGNTTSNAALVAGQGAGNALQAIYAQYKIDGNKYDYKNLQNIMNTVTLVANCEGLKENYKDKSYLTEFGKGMIASSLGLVTQNNVQTVTNGLVEMVKNSETVQNAQAKVNETANQDAQTANQAASYANTAAQYAGALSSLLSAFGGK